VREHGNSAAHPLDIAMTTDKKDRYFTISRRAGLLCSISVISFMFFGAVSDYIDQFAPWLIKLVMPLCMLSVLVSAAICVAAEICSRLKRKTEATPESSRQITQALWFLAAFSGFSLVAAISDHEIQGMPKISGFVRAVGPLGAILGSVLSLVFGIRFKDVRFLLTGMPSIGLMIYWVWLFMRM
jgi:hypothetical protein